MTITVSPSSLNLLKDCPRCGKTANEIKKVLKEGPIQDKEKLKKRYEEIMKLREELKKEKTT